MRMNSRIWKQADSRWGSKPYPTRDCTMSGAGCGCVACTHIAMEQTRYWNWTPENLRTWMVNQGFAIRNQGTTYSGITKTLQHIGHSDVVVVGTADPMSKVWNECNKGNRIGIILFRSGQYNGVRWTGSGHYVAFTGYKVSNGKHYFYCKDSGGRNHDGWFSYENSMRGLVYMAWIVSKINPKTTDKLVVDGYGGVATISKLQAFLGVPVTGEISNTKARHKYCASINSVTYESAQSPTVRALQKWSGVLMDGYWGAGTSKALQKKLGIKQTGYFDRASMKALQKYLNLHSKATYPTLTKQQKAQQFAYDCYLNGYPYVFFTDDERTHECHWCYAKKHGKQLPKRFQGGQCIKFAWSCLYHGGGIPCRHDGEVINNAMADRLLALKHADALELIRQRTGVKEWQLIRNGKGISASDLRVADVLLYYDKNGYTHTGLYVGKGKIADCTSSKNCNYGGAYNYGDTCKVAIRYIGK